MNFEIKILHIENQKLDSEIFQYFLDQSNVINAQVTTARTFKQIKATQQVENFDLIISSLNLPDHKADKLPPRLVEMFPEAPVIVWTCHDKKSLMASASQAGCFDYLLKDETDAKTLERSILNTMDLFRKNRNSLNLQEKLFESEKIKTLGLLAGGIAHDFNNRLAIIKNLFEIIKMDLSDDHKAHRYIQKIDDNITKTVSLISQITAFGRTQELCRDKGDLRDVALSTVSMVKTLIRNDVELRFKEGTKPAFAQFDPSKIDQVLMNLIMNANQAMDKEDAFIEISCGVQFINREDFPSNGDFQPGLFSYVEIKDNGCGMSEEIQKQIFDPYFTNRKEGEGTGLGLSVVDGVVHQHEGFIHVESQEGEGSAFRMYLPFVEPDEKEDQILFSQQSLDESDECTILYAEDDKDLRELTTELLKASGFQILVAEDGAQGFEVYQKHAEQINVILSDYKMPNMNGKEFMDAVHNLDPEVGFVFLTGFSHANLTASGPFPSHCKILSKPIDMETLLEALNQTARKKQATGDLNKAS